MTTMRRPPTSLILAAGLATAAHAQDPAAQPAPAAPAPRRPSRAPAGHDGQVSLKLVVLRVVDVVAQAQGQVVRAPARLAA